MLLPADRVLDSLAKEFETLRGQIADADTDASAAQAIGNAIRLLQAREHGGLDVVRKQIETLSYALDKFGTSLSTGVLASQVGRIRTLLAQGRVEQNVQAMESLWRDAVKSTQALVATAIAETKISASDKATMMRALVEWESGDLLRQLEITTSIEAGSAAAVNITEEKLTAYLRDRFNEATLKLLSMTPLAGGFGKQTILFDVEGRALAGSFVMRRDIGDGVGVDNDCHRIRNEYQVIRAVFERGFPAPDALWLDTEHKLLPGGDFIIMRKSPGKLGGNFFGAQTDIPSDLADSLADIMAKLHSLPPLTELGDLTDSIRKDIWELSQGESTARYIQGWYDFYLKSAHTPSPALVSLYGWLLSNVPKRRARSVLLHGDIGFHNFLFDNGRLSAVLDWEFAHIGDPAEDLGYVKVTVGKSLDWDRLMARYEAAGGQPVDAQTLRFFQVWAYVRNASAANILSTCFSTGQVQDLKLTVLPHGHIPHFIRGALAMIEAPNA